MIAVAGLREHLIRRIALEGPLTLARYMEECLGNPKWGYYMTRDPLGRAGDFTTAPEISQMFGELLGLWAAVQWQALGEPETLHFVELGPGRGTLMADALRAAAGVPGFRDAARVHLVETSPVLRAAQEATLAAAHPDVRPHWWNDFSQVPAGPLVLIANEFFDALPIRQFERSEAGWHERLVALDDAGRGLRWVLSPPEFSTPLIPGHLQDAAPGMVVEICPAGLRKMHTLAARLKSVPGVALVIDYGHGEGAAGDSLQAVRAHAYDDPLAHPGEADLTAHVDFRQLADTALAAGALTFGPMDQGGFLAALGIGPRAQTLAAGADDRQRADIETAVRRLVGDWPDAMGRLFKVLAVQHPALPPPPGFS